MTLTAMVFQMIKTGAQIHQGIQPWIVLVAKMLMMMVIQMVAMYSSTNLHNGMILMVMGLGITTDPMTTMATSVQMSQV